MSIKYSLTPNYFNKEEKTFVARVHSKETVGLETIAERMVKEGATISADNVLTVLHQAVDVIESLLINGYRVNFNELVHIYPSIKGEFNSMADGFDSSRHTLHIGARTGERLRNTVVSESNMEKISSSIPQPLVFEYVDVQSDEINQRVTASSTASVRGENLKFNIEADDEGIFFINKSDSTETKVNSILKVLPGEVIFQTPQDITGSTEYSLEVRCRINSGQILRSGVLANTLVGA